jgi:hypothetical protein
MSLQLHDLLFSSEEDILQAIRDDPETLGRVDGGSNLPLHLECQHQCRSAIIMKCIELYPEALAIENKDHALPLHLLLWNSASSTEDVFMMIEEYPAALRCEASLRFSNAKYLPLHVECTYHCRSAVIMKCIELYPEALSLANQADAMPLHLLLSNRASTIEDALMMIEKYPAALQVKASESYFDASGLPLHTECKNRCRSAIISKCIELYPESLSLPNENGALALHMLLNKSISSADTAIMMIEAYPDALRCYETSTFMNEKNLPLHIECMKQCRSAIISKCIELYPEALSIPSGNDSLPLHRLLSNQVSSIEDALMMIEKYPQALKLKNHSSWRSTDLDLPIHIECYMQCRPAVLSKCIELYPQSLNISDADGNIPWIVALNKMYLFSYDSVYELRKSLLVLLLANPACLYQPLDDPVIDKHPMMQDAGCRRLILNLPPSCLLSMEHKQAYHDLNWQPRSSLLHLWLQIRLKSDREEARSLEQLLSMAEPCHELSSKDRSMRVLLMKMLKESSLLVSRDGEVGYSVDLGDGIGDLMLCFIMAYL